MSWPSWHCKKCGAIITAPTASELGMKVAAHLDSHK